MNLPNSLVMKINQLQEVHGGAVESERGQFQFEIDMLGERIRELEREKEVSI